jgi:mRNA interferase MazF
VAAVARGQVWLVDLDPTRGREQAGRRPALVVSADGLNRSQAGVVVVAPMTTRSREIPSHVEVSPPDGGVHQTSYVRCEDIRSVALQRLVDGPFGVVSAAVMGRVEETMRFLLEL